ncbi:hypothetical protein [Nocardia bovistercoris]|uniref:Uncharacterized protein n=1 Tax=Nocardia bovistercoris TaxID=2785916 RepID=A0A931N1C0_9NOCA|nr:hypothetical protein [Nocardia bovistercoris]MBH0778205.1 hypothetical protein [Nocardia bovistercoris]
MKLRSFLQRRHADQVPLLPSRDPEESADTGKHIVRRAKSNAREEKLERLLTPDEREIVEQHRL